MAEPRTIRLFCQGKELPVPRRELMRHCDIFEKREGLWGRPSYTVETETTFAIFHQFISSLLAGKPPKLFRSKSDFCSLLRLIEEFDCNPLRRHLFSLVCSAKDRRTAKPGPSCMQTAPSVMVRQSAFSWDPRRPVAGGVLDSLKGPPPRFMVQSSGAAGNPESVAMARVKSHPFETADVADQWIAFRFPSAQVDVAGYSIGSARLKNWKIEGSRDDRTWTLLDEQKESDKFFRDGTVYFPVSAGATQMRAVRLWQTGESLEEDHILSLWSFELWGTICERATAP
jgi:hypothetical protein